MKALQAPMGTPFSASSTATDVLDGLDLTGQEVIVTGGHGRLGREVSRALAAAGAAVTVAARDPQRAAVAVAGIAGLRVEQLDLADAGSVEAFAQHWLTSGRPLHVLINNAALFPSELMRDARGHELTFSTSHLGHFQLTRALLPALHAAGGARVVNVTSGAARVGALVGASFGVPAGIGARMADTGDRSRSVNRLTPTATPVAPSARAAKAATSTFTRTRRRSGGAEKTVTRVPAASSAHSRSATSSLDIGPAATWPVTRTSAQPAFPRMVTEPSSQAERGCQTIRRWRPVSVACRPGPETVTVAVADASGGPSTRTSATSCGVPGAT